MSFYGSFNQNIEEISVERRIIQIVSEKLPFYKLVSIIRQSYSTIINNAIEEPFTITFKIDESTNYSSSKNQQISQTENASGSLISDSITTKTVNTHLLA